MAVNSYGADGGAERWLTDLLGDAIEVEVRALVLGRGPLTARLAQVGWDVDVAEVGRRPTQAMVAALSLGRQLHTHRPDVVLANGIKAGVVAVPAAALAGVPVVWARHDFSFEGRPARALAKLADLVVSTSFEVGETLGRDDVVVIPPPLGASSLLTRARARERLGLREVRGLLDLAMVGRVVGYKGVSDAVSALARPGGERWRLVVVGDEDDTDPGEIARVRELAAALGVDDRLVLCGGVPDAARLMCAFDAVAVLTRSAGGRGPTGEGFGLTALEAMAAGVPLVVAAGGGLEGRVEGAAHVVTPGEPDKVAAALAVLSAPERRAELGAAGRRLAAAHPTTQALRQRLAAVLSEAARRPARVGAAHSPISVVVPVHNEGASVDELLEALLPQLAAEDELIVVDDCSRDDTLERLERWQVADPGRVTVLRRDVNGGAAAARNDGCAIARHSFIAFTDAGVRPVPGWLAAVRAALDGPARLAWVAGSYAVAAQNTLERAMAAAHHPTPDEVIRRGPWLRLYCRVFGQDHRVDRPPGRSMGVSSDALAAVGGWDPELRTAEEADLARRLADAGGRGALEADAIVLWRPRPTLRATWRMYVRYAEGDVRGGDRRALRRALVRGLAYPGLALVVAKGGVLGWVVAALGAAAYLSVPVARASRGETPGRVIALLPVTMAVKDLAKAYGSARAAVRGAGDGERRP